MLFPCGVSIWHGNVHAGTPCTDKAPCSFVHGLGTGCSSSMTTLVIIGVLYPEFLENIQGSKVGSDLGTTQLTSWCRCRGGAGLLVISSETCADAAWKLWWDICTGELVYSRTWRLECPTGQLVKGLMINWTKDKCFTRFRAEEVIMVTGRSGTVGSLL